MVDIRELARACGVSPATVSRALNGHPEVNVDTRARIVATAQELGYHPTQAARVLVRGHSDVVGLIWDTGYEVQGRRHPFLSELLTRLKRALADREYHLMLLSTGADGYLRVVRQHQLAGVLLMGVDEQHQNVRALIDAGVPSVGIDLGIAGPRASYVTSDNRDGARRAVAHLRSLGHSRIATITGPLDLLPAQERLAGYRAALGDLARDDYVVEGDFFLPSGHAGMERLLALDEPPTAVFAAGDEMAIGALHAAIGRGLEVPRELALMGFDDIEAASLVRPALSTTRQDLDGLAIAAVDALHALVAKEDPDPVTIPTELLLRGSC